LLSGCAAGNDEPSGADTVIPAVIVATDKGWDASGLHGPIPKPGACRYRHTSSGEVLPDPACTPGAIDTAVTDGNVRLTVCRKGGYTASVRPPLALTEPVKKQLMAAYGISWSQASNFELDHLVPENAGGSSDVRNLFPEPNTDAGRHARSEYVHNDKDAVESWSHTSVCKGKTTVTSVRQAMAANWTTAVQVLGLPPISANYRG
jgi:hypothetical protein